MPYSVFLHPVIYCVLCEFLSALPLSFVSLLYVVYFINTLAFHDFCNILIALVHLLLTPYITPSL